MQCLEVLDQVSPLAYMVMMPPSLVAIHDDLHVSQLRKVFMIPHM
jgi:hypothetical protein